MPQDTDVSVVPSVPSMADIDIFLDHANHAISSMKAAIAQMEPYIIAARQVLGVRYTYGRIDAAKGRSGGCIGTGHDVTKLSDEVLLDVFHEQQSRLDEGLECELLPTLLRAEILRRMSQRVLNNRPERLAGEDGGGMTISVGPAIAAKCSGCGCAIRDGETGFRPMDAAEADLTAYCMKCGAERGGISRDQLRTGYLNHAATLNESGSQGQGMLLVDRAALQAAIDTKVKVLRRGGSGVATNPRSGTMMHESLRCQVHQMMTQMDGDNIPHEARRIKVKDLGRFSAAFLAEQKNPFEVAADGKTVTHVYGVPVAEDVELGYPVAMTVEWE